MTTQNHKASENTRAKKGIHAHFQNLFRDCSFAATGLAQNEKKVAFFLWRCHRHGWHKPSVPNTWRDSSSKYRNSRHHGERRWNANASLCVHFSPQANVCWHREGMTRRELGLKETLWRVCQISIVLLVLLCCPDKNTRMQVSARDWPRTHEGNATMHGPRNKATIKEKTLPRRCQLNDSAHTTYPLIRSIPFRCFFE